MPMRYSRRGFLALAGGAAAMPASRPSAVSLVAGDERRKNVFNALVAIDDQVRPLLKRKRYVLLKPNCVAVKNQLGSTHADALRGILDYLEPQHAGRLREFPLRPRHLRVPGPQDPVGGPERGGTVRTVRDHGPRTGT